ncbi:hypothetical protein E2C01_076718 [Portunus trituberculatus]|uniref:Uncharacterized protein n=1 Tax=Portunus trituberculatus TaxID=210409 RepID=A0A5B7IIC8_PORTR|nr:hypothetical protein [Portunus trituberculatus]
MGLATQEGELEGRASFVRGVCLPTSEPWAYRCSNLEDRFLGLLIVEGAGQGVSVVTSYAPEQTQH